MFSHGFRKFFITQCDKAHISFTVREYLSGHQLPYVDANYIRTTEEERLQEYVKAIPLLTIDPTQRLQKKVKELEGQQAQEIANLKVQLQTYEGELSKSRQFENYAGQMIEKMQSIFNDIEVRTKEYHEKIGDFRPKPTSTDD